jgi:predicted TIM-barrel fold metal-dependent hydrolase
MLARMKHLMGENMAAKREAWRKLTVEDPIDPDLLICDPHHHLWDKPDSHYLLEDLLRDTGAGHRIARTVHVECKSMYREDGPEEMKPVGETEFVEAIVAGGASGQHGATRVAAGIVGFADLTLGAAVEAVLEAHIEAGHARFRGIRHISIWDASPDIISNMRAPKLLLDSRFREGFAYLRKHGLSFDAWLHHTQIMDLVDLAGAFPDTTIILDHMGTPLGIGPYAGKRKEVFVEWKRGIEALASYSNVVVKLGGLGMERCGFGWNNRTTPPGSAELAETMAPYFLWCIEQFGVDRCMFESNFPVDKESCSFIVLWNAFKRISKPFSPGERAALFHDTAVRVYRLPTDHEG